MIKLNNGIKRVVVVMMSLVMSVFMFGCANNEKFETDSINNNVNEVETDVTNEGDSESNAEMNKEDAPTGGNTKETKDEYSADVDTTEQTTQNDVESAEMTTDSKIEVDVETETIESTEVETEPETIINFEEVNETVWATQDVNIRKGPGTEYEIIGNLKGRESVVRTGIGDNGWSKISYNSENAYINSSYLTTSEPVVPKTQTYPIVYSGQ